MGIPFCVYIIHMMVVSSSNGAVHGDLDDTERPNDFCGGCGEYALALDNAAAAAILPRWKHPLTHMWYDTLPMISTTFGQLWPLVSVMSRVGDVADIVEARDQLRGLDEESEEKNGDEERGVGGDGAGKSPQKKRSSPKRAGCFAAWAVYIMFMAAYGAFFLGLTLTAIMSSCDSTVLGGKCMLRTYDISTSTSICNCYLFQAEPSDSIALEKTIDAMLLLTPGIMAIDVRNISASAVAINLPNRTQQLSSLTQICSSVTTSIVPQLGQNVTTLLLTAKINRLTEVPWSSFASPDQVEYLSVKNAPITSVSSADLKRATSLYYLNLEGCDLDAQGASSLVAAVTNTTGGPPCLNASVSLGGNGRLCSAGDHGEDVVRKMCDKKLLCRKRYEQVKTSEAGNCNGRGKGKAAFGSGPSSSQRPGSGQPCDPTKEQCHGGGGAGQPQPCDPSQPGGCHGAAGAGAGADGSPCKGAFDCQSNFCDMTQTSPTCKAAGPAGGGGTLGGGGAAPQPGGAGPCDPTKEQCHGGGGAGQPQPCDPSQPGGCHGAAGAGAGADGSPCQGGFDCQSNFSDIGAGLCRTP
jgi:hypothetical protein